MKMKKVAVTMIILFLVTKNYGQSFMHSYGWTIGLINGTVKNNAGKSGFGLASTGFCYYPRYNFLENENSSLSIGAPVSLGIGLVSSVDGSDGGILFSYDLPLALDYNIGCNSTPDNDRNFGGYFGIGFSFQKVNISNSSYSDFSGSTYGPLLRAGLRFSSSNESWKGHGLTAGLYYKMGLESDKLSTIGFHVLLDL